MTPAKEKKPRSAIGNVIELAATLVVAVGLALLIQAFIVKPYKIPSGSMVPTLAIHQRVLVNRLDTSPSLGEIVVFHPPAGATGNGNPVCENPDQGAGHSQACDDPTPAESSQTFIKRVVAGPGDTVAIINGHVYRNGLTLGRLHFRPRSAVSAGGMRACGANSHACRLSRRRITSTPTLPPSCSSSTAHRGGLTRRRDGQSVSIVRGLNSG